MAASMDPYDKWLRDKLLSHNQDIDMDVFGPYISGILEEDSSLEDKKDSLSGILEQVVEEGYDNLCDEILKQWGRIRDIQSSQIDETGHDKVSELAEMLENQKIEIVKPREVSKEMSEAKAAILAQYGTISSEDEEDDDSSDGGGAGPAGGGGGGGAVDKNDSLAFKNRNVESVLQSEREMKEKAKAETDKKKEKDKQDRDAQKQKQNERKDTEKKRTQKGERKR